MAATADQVLTVAKGWLGLKESDGSHKKILDVYNGHKPLARGYKVKATDSWCDAFVSACAIRAGATDIIGTECSCQRHIEIFKDKGIWIEDGTITPKKGDIILYNWDDSTQPNNGAADHIGYVERVSGSTITVIEGNKSDKVARRTIKVGAGNIRGYARPKYKTESSSSSTSSANYTAYKVDATNGLNLRKGPGTKYARVGGIADGGVVQVASISNGWAKTREGNWCSAQYLKKCTSSTPYVTTASKGLNFRTGPGTGYSKTRTVAQNLRVFIYGFRGNWALTTKGDWCHKSYLQKLTKKTVDANGGLNCRKGPGTNYAKTRLLKDGTTVYVRSISNGWAKTQANDYCASAYLK